MNKDTPADPPATAVPLGELLRQVPKDARYVYTEPDGLKATHFVPVGRYCHEAADALTTAPADPLRDKAYADFYPECDEEKSVYGIWCAAWAAALATKPAETAHEHDWHIWPETDGLEQRCSVCGAYRRTPEEDMFWKHQTESAGKSPIAEPAMTDRSPEFLAWWHELGRDLVPWSPDDIQAAEIGFEAGRALAHRSTPEPALDHVECKNCGNWFGCEACGSREPELHWREVGEGSASPPAARSVESNQPETPK